MKVCPKCEDLHNKPGVFCGRRCANSRVKSATLKRKLSQKMKGYKFGAALTGGWGNTRQPSPPVEKICPICLKDFTIRYVKRHQIYCSDICSRKRPNQGGFRLNSTRKTRSKFNGYQMDSGAELRFAKLLENTGIRWRKNASKSFAYLDVNGKERKYYPDFYLPDYDYWVEIKGKFYETPNDVLKLKAVGNNVELQYHNELRLPKCVL